MIDLVATPTEPPTCSLASPDPIIMLSILPLRARIKKKEKEGLASQTLLFPFCETTATCAYYM